MKAPYLEDRNGQKVLIVDEAPFIMIAGEAHNSSASNVKIMERIWERADELNLNTVLLPIYWEVIEPEEGKYDFSLVDSIIFQAREHRKKIGFLWFGSWKNAQCYYAPEWVKQDLKRFERAQLENGKNFKILENVHGLHYSTLSAFCEETKKADAAAFARLMEHICCIDRTEHTVITMQVENETGLLGEAREHGERAEKMFASSVPAPFLEYLKETYEELTPELASTIVRREEVLYGKSWSEIFGEMADEVFQCYYTARFVEAVAKAGKKEYDLPMTVNCWLDKGQKPGKYPTGGPVAKLMPIWKHAAPSIDIYGPDIYIQTFLKTCDCYTKGGNPLYIAECATHSYAGIRELYVIGHYHGMCYSPFGFEDIGLPFTATQGILFGMDTDDELLKTPQNAEEYTKINGLLNGMMSLLAEAYGTRHLQASISENGKNEVLSFVSYDFNIFYESRFLQTRSGACLVLEHEENEFFVIVKDCGLDIRSTKVEVPYTDFLSVDEGHFLDGMFISECRLNGDEITTMSFEGVHLLKIRVFSYC